SALGLIDKHAEYDDIKKVFEDNLPHDLIVYQEFHALIVEHAKRYCKTKPECGNCVLKKDCQ
ncbi:MAG: endonuclease III related protein, partial [Ignavibacteria bacterium]